MATVSTKRDRTAKLLRRFSSIKVSFEKEKEETITKFQEENLRAAIAASKCFNDKVEIRSKLQDSITCYSKPELYTNIIISALFPAMKSLERSDPFYLTQHLKQVFKIDENDHGQLMETAQALILPNRILNLQLMEAKNIPVTDANGLSDPFCVVFLSSRDEAKKTDVDYKTLNPVWKENFVFNVNDLRQDVLVLEVMDYNDAESIREKIKKIKEVKSAKTFKILLKELANLRSEQELIGSLSLYVSEISSETMEEWYKLKNPKNKGEIYLRMVLGYSKCREVAFEEFKQIIHCLLVHELDKGSSLDSPLSWDDNFEWWSKYILRQFKWQTGLKPKDVVLAKWVVYAKVNKIFPLNANMLCLLLDAVLERMYSGEYDSHDAVLFWNSIDDFVPTVTNMLIDVHDVFPCKLTMLNIYHMLKSIGLLCNFLSHPDASLHENSTFTTFNITERITTALRDGAVKFYAKLFPDSNSTLENIVPDQNALHDALEKLVHVGQLLHEDLRLGLTAIYSDFKGWLQILNIDYMWITYRVYDNQFGKAVKYIVEKYNDMLKHQADPFVDDNAFDENCTAVESGEILFKLYLAVKDLARLAPKKGLTETASEFSLKHGFHDWFFPSVDKWIDILRRRIIKGVKQSIALAGTSSDYTDNKLIVSQDSKEIPISSSAVDSAQKFMDILKLWQDLDWQNALQSHTIVTKIIEELYRYLGYYAAQLFETMNSYEPNEHEMADEAFVYNYIEEVPTILQTLCRSMNNIKYVKDHVELQTKTLNIPNIVESIRKFNQSPDVDDYEVKTDMIKEEVQLQIEDIVQKITSKILKAVSQKYSHLLQDAISAESCRNMSHRAKRLSAHRYRVLSFADYCISLFKKNLELQNLQQILPHFWIKAVDGIDKKLRSGIETGKSCCTFFQTYHDLLFHLRKLFWSGKSEQETREGSPSTFRQHDLLTTKLFFLEMPLEQLKTYYYKQRHNQQKSTTVANSVHGILTVRACLVEKDELIIVEVLNARQLKAYDSNGQSDPYVVVALTPKESYKNSTAYTTKWYRKHYIRGLMKSLPCTKIFREEMSRDGFLMLTLYDHDYLKSDDFMGEAFLPVKNLRKLDNTEMFESLEQTHLVLSKPSKDDEQLLKRFSERSWDENALHFAASERCKIEQ